MATNKTFSKDDSLDFELTLGEKNVVTRLSKMINNEDMDGIYCLLGYRGSGKTSLKEMAKEEAKKMRDSKDPLFVEIPYYIDKDNLYLNILNELERWLSNEDEVKKFSFDDESNIDKEMDENKVYKSIIQERVNFLSYIYSGELEEQSLVSHSDEKTKKNERRGKFLTKLGGSTGQEVNTPKFLPVKFSGKVSFEGFAEGEYAISNSNIKIDQLKNQLNLKKVITSQWKQDQVISVLKDISKKRQIFLVIDELDKLTLEEFRGLIYDNKSLLLESNLKTLLISDLFTGIEIEENLKEYISDFIILDKMSFRDFLIKRMNLANLNSNVEKNLLKFQEEFYVTEGINRKLINLNFSELDEDLSIISFYYNIFCMSAFCENTEKIYRNTLKKYTKELLLFIKITKFVSENQLKKFTERFVKNNQLENTNLKNLLENYFLFDPFKISSNYFYQDYFSDVFSDESYNVWKNGEMMHTISSYDKLSNDKILVYTDFETKFNEFKTNYNNYIEVNFEGNGRNFFDKYLSLNISQDRVYEITDKTKLLDKNKSGDTVYNHINQAQEIIKNKKNKIVGVYIFYTKGDEYVTKYINGFIFEKNDFDQVVIHEFVGYPGLTSHKPYLLDEFINFLDVEKVVYIHNKEPNNTYWETSQNKKDILKQLVDKY
ncbi:MAG: P-loop NTPase fold protein [Cetobacterium sp.]|uniref:P-loop NTPase fold protein n=1 Tax=Cetobacterium sp. TaxID=2071632 RepID=UPI002FC76175